MEVTLTASLMKVSGFLFFFNSLNNCHVLVEQNQTYENERKGTDHFVCCIRKKRAFSDLILLVLPWRSLVDCEDFSVFEIFIDKVYVLRTYCILSHDLYLAA